MENDLLNLIKNDISNNNINDNIINKWNEYLNKCIKIYNENNEKCSIYYPLNICVDNYFQNQKENTIVINKDSVIKVDLGLKFGNYNNRITRTISLKSNDKKRIKFINHKLKTIIQDYLNKDDEENEKTTDELRILIENECLKYNLYPLINCYSTEQNNERYFYLNYMKKYDENEYLIGYENICFELLQNDIWDINIELVEQENVNEKVYINDSDKYMFTGDRTSLKLNSSKMFYNNYKKYKDNKEVFVFNKYNALAKDKIGLKECIEKQIINNLPEKSIKKGNVYIFRDTFKIL